jgi:uncharacterized protein YihD (DUF1040 family)
MSVMTAGESFKRVLRLSQALKKLAADSVYTVKTSQNTVSILIYAINLIAASADEYWARAIFHS